MSDTTVVLTSCGRQDLLRRTLESFLRFNTAAIQQFIIIEDGAADLNEGLKGEFSTDVFLWLATGVRVGQIRGIL